SCTVLKTNGFGDKFVEFNLVDVRLLFVNRRVPKLDTVYPLEHSNGIGLLYDAQHFPDTSD
ncbi:hypothetical protein, partial [Scytonema sp. PCC 10023]|uniref:hypothetical protein n=1 Tax=Scytonema sp. PCC 10023 TaxID=1680591 RepID=UPI0039C5D878